MDAPAAKSLQSCPTLCNSIDGSPSGSPVPGILQARTGAGCHFLLQCVKVKSEREVAQLCQTLCDPMDCSLPGSSVHSSSGTLSIRSAAAAKSLQSCPTLCDPIDGSPPGSSVPGILQARILEGKIREGWGCPLLCFCQCQEENVPELAWRCKEEERQV